MTGEVSIDQSGTIKDQDIGPCNATLARALCDLLKKRGLGED